MSYKCCIIEATIESVVRSYVQVVSLVMKSESRITKENSRKHLLLYAQYLKAYVYAVMREVHGTLVT